MTPVAICAVADIADGGTRRLAATAPRAPDAFLVRRGDRVFGYVDNCPHRDLPLHFIPGRYLSPDGTAILCVNHGARFDVETGACLGGPCAGLSLTPLPLEASGRVVRLAPAAAGRWRLAPDGRRTPALPG